MPSAKTRINLTVPSAVEQSLARLAKRDETTVATVALDLIHRALETEEDVALLAVAKARSGKTRFVSHGRAWK